MAIEVLVFDLGKVIFDFDIDKLARGLHLTSNISKNDVAELISGHRDIFTNYEKGFVSSEEFYGRMSALLNLETDYKSFCGIWNDIFTPLDHMPDLVKMLSGKYPVSMLSNTNDLHFEYLKNKYPETFSHFKNFHLSYKMGARKPDAEIYEKVIDFYGINPADIFFTDDLGINVSAARKTGITAFKFEGPEQLKSNLESVGVVF